MVMAYGDPRRESDPYALPDVELFRVPQDLKSGDLEPGWYWWACLPGCLPDSEPVGPFAMREEALEDVRHDQSD